VAEVFASGYPERTHRSLHSACIVRLGA